MFALFNRDNRSRGRMGRKGNLEIFSWILIAGATLITVGILAYVIAILDDSITNTTVNTIYNNTLQMFVNFTGQLGPVGTLAGVFLIFGLLGLAGFGLWRAGRRGGMF